MSKPVSKMAEPSIDEMLSSIRDAIHEETEREAEEHARTFKPRSEPRKLEPELRRPEVPPPPSPPQVPLQAQPTKAPQAPQPQTTGVSGSMRELRVSLQPAGHTHSRGTVTARSEDFLSLKSKLASLRHSPSSSEPHSRPPADASMAGVMSGDVRLEDALARAEAPAPTLRPKPSVEPRLVAPEQRQAARALPATNKPVVESQMRATIDEVANDQADIDYLPVEEAQAAPRPIAIVVDPVPGEPVRAEFVAAEPEFAPPPMTADQEILDYTAVASAATPPQLEPASVGQAAQVTEVPVEAVVHQPAPVEPAKVLQQHEPPVPATLEAAPMMSGESMLAASNAFELLSREIFSKSSGGEQVLEEAARDMVKPMLKKWLDDNLPTLVERLVREEIERVARKGGR